MCEENTINKIRNTGRNIANCALLHSRMIGFIFVTINPYNVADNKSKSEIHKVHADYYHYDMGCYQNIRYKGKEVTKYKL